MAAAAEVDRMVVQLAFGMHLVVVVLQSDCRVHPRIWQQLLAVAVVHMDSVVLVVEAQVDYRSSRQVIHILVEHRPQVEQVDIQSMVIPERTVLHTKVEIQKMKAAEVVAVTLAAAAAETTLAAAADQVMSHS
jgi:hypothetical protein